LETDTNLKNIILSIINAGIDAAKPSKLVRDKINYSSGVLSIDDESHDLNNYDKVYVIGFGKVSAAMALEIENILGSRISDGLIITNSTDHSELDIIKVRIGDHPILDDKVIIASREILDICSKATQKDLVICLISGGGSALFELLPEEIKLKDMQELTKLLLYSGASIDEINKVRKCFSSVKNGGLLKFIHPAECVSLIISDVVGDHIESIASSPTFYDTTSFKKAYEILQFYHLLEKVPVNISEYLLYGLRNESEESKETSSYKSCLSNIIIGRNYESLLAAEETAKQYQLNTIILTSKIQGEARDVAKVFGAIIDEINERNIPVPKPACIIAGGETTVTVKGQGIGGRNQELALSTLISLKESKSKFAFASCGSDGIDGVTSAAGGYVDYKMWEVINNKKIFPNEYLINNDSFHFLKAVNGLIHISPGQTNVMDIMIGIIN